MSDSIGLMVSVFLASAVEFVEALTIVLAMGMTRGWRSALAGVAAALVALTVTAAVAGYAIAEWLPESLLQLIVGTLLLIFGLQWLRKAVLRAAGLKAHNDEEETFRAELEAGRQAGSERRAGLVCRPVALSLLPQARHGSPRRAFRRRGRRRMAGRFCRGGGRTH